MLLTKVIRKQVKSNIRLNISNEDFKPKHILPIPPLTTAVSSVPRRHLSHIKANVDEYLAEEMIKQL